MLVAGGRGSWGRGQRLWGGRVQVRTCLASVVARGCARLGTLSAVELQANMFERYQSPPGRLHVRWQLASRCPFPHISATPPHNKPSMPLVSACFV